MPRIFQTAVAIGRFASDGPTSFGISAEMASTAPEATPITFYLLQEDESSSFILEDSSGFILLESAP